VKGEISERCARRKSHAAFRALEKAMPDAFDQRNKEPRQVVRLADADPMLSKVAYLSKGTSDSGG